jgi:hypothetical protein
MTLDEIKQAIARLSAHELAALRVWLAEIDAEPSESSEPPSTSEKLGRLAGRAFADFRNRMRDK